MQTSFANGGQLSASNAEVWNTPATLIKGLRWMLQKDAPLLLNPAPGWHKYSWMAEFTANIPKYKSNTIETVELAIAAREHLLKKKILPLITRVRGFYISTTLRKAFAMPRRSTGCCKQGDWKDML